MTEKSHAEDSRLLTVASSIAEGTPVDWNDTPDLGDRETTAVFDELRLIEQFGKLNDPIPNTWGPFTITGEIGQGSYGTVYRAFDPNLDLEVALKIIRPRTATETIDPSRALHEARLLAQITHQNVVRVYRAERVGDEVGVSMELVKGRTLDDLVRRYGALNASDAMRIGVDLCRALAAVHGALLVHGDVKAQNVMRSDDGRTLLMDFGAGRDLKRGQPRSEW